ncbi:amino acid adenylation domain-containing protein [Burkholderia sp. 22PA0099]|uniref:amino acid adenylation domain-containing protein n=1 Tax=Burkholderia sp. 22PA0099 TaxID=3237372 RepID=UPI0039C132C1
MDKTTAARIAARFIDLTPDKRRLFWEKMQAEGVSVAQFPILPRSRETHETHAVPVSYAQRRQWVLAQLSPDSRAYHVSGGLWLTGEVDGAALREAFAAIVARHAVLRTRFVANAAGEVEAFVDEAASIDWCEETVASDALEAAARALADAPFDLSAGPLLRAALYRDAGEGRHLLAVSMHHIVSDGWSVQVLLGELVAHYRARVLGEPAQLAALPIQYADYAAWQRDWLEVGERERQLAYWKATLGDSHPVLALPMDGLRNSHGDYTAGRHALDLPASLSQAIKACAQQQSVTPFMLLLAAFQALLHRYTGQDDIRVGVPVANRNRVETEGLIGFFVNTQVMRASFDGDETLGDLLGRLRDTTVGAQAHQELPFDALVEALRPERSLSHSPLFQVMFNHQRRDWRMLDTLPGLHIEPHPLPTTMAQFELMLNTQEAVDGAITIEWTYARELFDAATIERFAAHYLRCVEAIAQGPLTARIADIALTGEAERATLDAWSRNRTQYDEIEPVFHAFERHAAAHPDDEALVLGSDALTYAELNDRANRLAHWLRSRGVGAESRVGVSAERSLELVIALYAIMKAGAAYVPLDPSYPADRIAAMIDDSGIALLLAQRDVALPACDGVERVDLETLDLSESSAFPATNPNVKLHGTNLAYVIFTSGSTGRPKGVGNSHDGLSNRLIWMQREYGLQRGETVLQKTPFSFDVSVWEFFWPLMVGARLAIAAPGAHRDPAELAQTIVAHRVTTLHFVPSMLQAFMASDTAASCGATLKRIVCSGEALPADLSTRTAAVLPGVALHNLYGPTEAAIDVTAWTCIDEAGRPVPIGRPIAATQTWVLDARLNPVPPGVPGELYLGGAGLARGYLGRPDLTADRFVPDPFADAPGARLYRTGDLARWRTDGAIDYLGRIDHQVKIRGLRIELGEIEAALTADAAVREAVVIAHEGRLVAYVTGDQPDTANLRTALAARLPDYMVPWRILALAALPLNPNGKVDRRALPLPETDTEAAANYEAPQDGAETELAAIWSALLRGARVGRRDDFFELGGDSILALQIVARARQAGYVLTARQIFEQATIAELAAVAQPMDGRDADAQRAAADEAEEAAAIADGAPVALMPVQAWFLAQPLANRNHWNQSVLLHLDTAPDAARLDQALHAVAAAHPALRLRFAHDAAANAWRQRIGALDAAPLVATQTGVAPDAIDAACDAIQSTLDIEHGPLLRALVLGVSDGSWRIAIAIHHLAVDTVSWRILLGDLHRAYRQLGAGEPVALPAPTLSYPGFARRVHEAARRADVAASLGDWLAIGAFDAALPASVVGAPAVPAVSHTASIAAGAADAALPAGAVSAPAASAVSHTAPITVGAADAALPADASATPAVPHTASITLDSDTTRRLQQPACAAYRTQLADLLLVATGRALCAFAGREALRIDVEGHGRDAPVGEADLSRTVGWFTSIHPLALAPAGEIGAAIKRVKEARRNLPHGGASFGMLRYAGDAEARAALAAVGAADVLFNYLGQFDGALTSAGDGGDAWRLAAERGGRAVGAGNAPSHALDIAAQIRDGALSIALRHPGGDRFDAAALDALAASLHAELLAVLAHCTSGAAGLTPSDVPLAAIDQARLDALPVAAAELADLYPLAPMQAGIVFHSLLGAQQHAYVNQLRVDADGLDPVRFEAAWAAVAQRHEMLRTGVLAFDDQPRQWVARTVATPFAALDLRDEAGGSPAALADRLDRFSADDLARGFDLAAPPLWRVTLLRTGDTRHHVVWTFHHVLLDGWSAAQLLAEVLAIYGGAAPAATDAPPRYRRFVGWLAAQPREASDAWWQAQTARLDGPSLLTHALPAPVAALAARHGIVHLRCDAPRTARLAAFARAQRATLSALVQAAWLVLLQRYTGQRTVTFGATVAGRPDSLPGADRMLGLFINTIPVIGTPAPSMRVGEWLAAVQRDGVAAREHEHLPLADIQRRAGIEGGQPMFDTLLVFENYPVDAILDDASPHGLRFSGLRNEDRTSYPLTLSVTQGRAAHAAAPGEVGVSGDKAQGDAGQLDIEFAYAGDLFTQAQIERLAAQFGALLDAFAADAATPLGALDPLPHAERAQLAAWGQGADAPALPPVHRRIAAQAARRPHATALVHDGETLDYGKLEARANRIAHALRAAGVGPDVRVGIAIERSLGMIVAILGVLKAGGAYVPLDPSYPAERLAMMIEDSGIALALTEHAGADDRGRLPVPALDIAALAAETSGHPAVAPACEVRGEHLAYLIYTSGSTGRPKGVGITHDALARHTEVSIDMFGIGETDRVLQFSTFNFDGFVEQVFPALASGAALIVRGPELWSTGRFVDEVARERITVADLTTAYWNALAQDFAARPEARQALATLRCVHAGGEAMPADGVRAWRAAGLSGVTLANTYGPSEATVTATRFDCGALLRDAGRDVPAQIPLGGPLPGRTLAVLDAHGNLAPLGAAGELCIGGPLLARGYHDRPGLTAERFVADPFAATPGARLYRTGDIVRWHDDGSLAYLGRADHQVKIRGFRIELGEIESVLLQDARVREAAVITRDGPGGLRVLAYVAPAAGVALAGSALRASLAGRLPDYMVPAAVVVLDALPLNPNGKIDRRALPEPAAQAADGDEAWPVGETETALAGIWSTLLGVTPVRRTDRFFELGGHSLAAMQAQSAIRAKLGAEVALVDLMRNPPLAALAESVDALRAPASSDADIAAELNDILAGL